MKRTHAISSLLGGREEKGRTSFYKSRDGEKGDNRLYSALLGCVRGRKTTTKTTLTKEIVEQSRTVHACIDNKSSAVVGCF